MSQPLVITLDSLKDELAGNAAGRYLLRISRSTTAQEKQADVDAMLTKSIQEAQGVFESETFTFLTQRKVLTYPPEPDANGNLPVLGTDYDAADSGYDYMKVDWHETFGSLKLKHRPVVSVEALKLRYGQLGTPSIALNFPDQWKIIDYRLGLVHIIPIIGVGAYAAATLAILTVAGANLANTNTLPNVIAVDYTAGFLPKDFDAETDDPLIASPFEDVRPYLACVRYIAAAKVLRKLNRTLTMTGGSISIDGLSQSKQPNALQGYIDDYEKQAKELKDLALRARRPAFFTA